MYDTASHVKPREQPMVVDLSHSLYYDSPHTRRRKALLGYPVPQSPIDLRLYPELVARQRPAFILQTGVMHGRSVLYFALPKTPTSTAIPAAAVRRRAVRGRQAVFGGGS
jgi:cephalosporin hydroxylase